MAFCYASKSQIFHAADRTKVETTWIEKAQEFNKSWKITGDNETGFTFKSSDSIWGGDIKGINVEAMKNIFDFELHTKKHNDANKQLYDLAKAEDQSGNPWFLSSLDHLMLENLIDIYPEYYRNGSGSC